MLIRLIEAEQTYPLRQSVLRPGQDLSACQWPQDFDSATFHVGAFAEGRESPICIATFYPEPCPIKEIESGAYPFRLRGMATDPGYRRQGSASQVLLRGIQEIQNRQGSLLWFNARQNAFSFYESLGFHFYGKLFEIEGVGPHKVMYLPLSSAVIDE